MSVEEKKKLTTAEVDAMIKEHKYGTKNRTQIVFSQIIGGAVTVAVIGFVFWLVSLIF